MKKIQIMERYYAIHGNASSAAEMAGEIRKRYPAKKSAYTQECVEFLAKKREECFKNRDKQNFLDDMVATGMNVFSKAFKEAKLTWML